jgi:hypothetical protein
MKRNYAVDGTIIDACEFFSLSSPNEERAGVRSFDFSKIGQTSYPDPIPAFAWGEGTSVNDIIPL